jgi:hypothetical protein
MIRYWSKRMRKRLVSAATLAAIVGVALLAISCASLGLATRAGMLPPLDWQITAGPYQALLIHNGPTYACSPYALRDSCDHRSVSYEFYVHYITPTQNRVLVWFATKAPE